MEMKIPKTAAKSAQIITSIDDLLTEILLQLPIKSLLRFKTVSKHWQSLITNPQFRRRRNPNPNPAVGLFSPRTDFRMNPLFKFIPFSPNKRITRPFEKLKFTKDPSGSITILQSCNGLLLCSSFQARDGETIYYVYNPTIANQFSTLPKLDGARIRGMNLAFDPAKSPHYNIICVRDPEELGSEDSGYHQMEIYSSDAGSWRIIGEPFEAEVFSFKNGVYWNDAVHWIGRDDGSSLYFNLRHQVLDKMPDPPIPGAGDVRRRGYYFGESCDHLHYVQICGSAGIGFNVHEMNKDYSEWFVKYSVNLSVAADNAGMISRGYFNRREWFYFPFSILSIVRCGEEEEDESFLVLLIAKKVIRYNLVSKTFEILREFESLQNFSGNGFQYIESLCSI